MRLMVVYYNGNENAIADIHRDDVNQLTHAEVSDDCEDIIAVVEVLGGVDYDKSQARSAAPNSAHFSTMLIK